MPGRNRLSRMAVMVVAAGVLVLFSAGGMFRPWRERLLGAFVPVFFLVRRAADWVEARVEWVPARRVSELETERVRLLAEVAEREGFRRENEALRTALALRSEGEPGVLPAAAVGFLREGRDEFLLLDRGVADGIGVGDLVLDRRRVLAGTIVSVELRAARAILLSSASRSIEVIVARTDLRAIARGANVRELIVDLVPHDADIRVGDLLVASPRATGGRRAILVGEVREVMPAEREVFQVVRAVHLFDPAETDVLVLLAP